MLVWALAGLLGAGCDGSGPECRVGADCASGVCRSDGTCEPLEDGGKDGGADGSADGEDGGEDGGEDEGQDGGDDGGEGTGDDGGSLTCRPNDDWRVERGEVPIRAGLRATFRIGRDTSVDMAGERRPDGSRRWDLSGALENDHSVLVETRDPLGAWWAPDFPAATYAAQLRDGQELLGVFQATEDALRLLGVVSPTDTYPATKLSYDPPVDVLRFPLERGLAWGTTSTVTGYSLGVISYYQESYANQVDAHGELATPYAVFPVLRVRVALTRTVGMAVTTSRTFAFVAECFGTVATVNSRDYESEVEFSQAVEARRLAP
jgi:hypothetical protein